MKGLKKRKTNLGLRVNSMEYKGTDMNVMKQGIHSAENKLIKRKKKSTTNTTMSN